MKLKDLQKHLAKIIKEDPDAKEYEVIYSSDDEGNHFAKATYLPATGTFHDGEFDTPGGKKHDSICIN